MQYIHKISPCGPIKGIGKSDYNLFKGIRYATAERWQAPVEVTQWDGVYDATITGPYCCQYNAYIKEKTAVGQFYFDETADKPAVVYSEDCLNLNIWTPVNAEKSPVLVFIHGGSYETGGGSAPVQSGHAYCRNGIILVTISYRLNAFASAVGDGYTGNYGLQDQICALQWIKHNIAAFGGNPDKVTIMGESAGAMSVQNLIYSPLAKGLFHAAIMLSGGGILPEAFRIKTPETAEALWNEVKTVLQAPDMQTLASTSPDVLYKTWLRIYTANPQYAQPATPVVDGYTIPDMPSVLANEGNVNGVPTIIGVLSEDMWPLTLYHSARDWGISMERTGHSPVYGFYFDRAVPGSNHGAYHAADMRYVFESFDSSWRPYEETDFRISEEIISYLSAFVKTGIPFVEGRPVWDPITLSSQQFMHFGSSLCGMCDVPEERLLAFQKQNRPFPGM